MPYKQDIELYLIATLIAFPSLLRRLNIKDEYFYHSTPSSAYKVLKTMIRKNEEINLVTFGGRFFDEGGKISEIRPLYDDFENVSIVFAESYLKQLAEESAKREILKHYDKVSDAPREFIEEVKRIEVEFVDFKPQSASEIYGDYLTGYNERKDRLQNKGSVGLITGFKVLDSEFSFLPGNLVILAASTNVGKTALALNIAVNASMYKQKALFFSAEMTIEEIMNRVMSQLTGVSATKFKYANADHSLKQAKTELGACGENLKLIQASSMTSEDVCRIARQEDGLKKVDLVVVDYIQYMKDQVGKGTNNDRIGNITRNLKELAMEIGCPVLALSQLNRGVTEVPELKHLRDSGNIEQDADMVLMLHRESKEDVVANLAVAKNRNGSISPQNMLKFKPEITKFYD